MIGGPPLLSRVIQVNSKETLVKVNQERSWQETWGANIINYSSRYQIEELGAVQTEKQGKKMKHESQKKKRKSRPDSSTYFRVSWSYMSRQSSKNRPFRVNIETAKKKQQNGKDYWFDMLCPHVVVVAGHCVVLCGAATLVTLYIHKQARAGWWFVGHCQTWASI